MKGINNDKLLKAAQQVQEEYPEEVQSHTLATVKARYMPHLRAIPASWSY